MVAEPTDRTITSLLRTRHRTRGRRRSLAVASAVAALVGGLVTLAAQPQTAIGAAGEPGVEMAVTVAGVPVRDASVINDGTEVNVGVNGLLAPGTQTRELRASLDAGMRYTAGGAEAPEGWTIEYSTDDGANWSPTEPTPASDVTDVRAVASVTAGAIAGYSQLYSSETVAPIPSSSFSGSTGGDGWDVFFSDDFVFNIFHHSSNIVLDCHLRSTGERCAGYTATFAGYAASMRSGGWVDTITGKLYAFTAEGSTGRPGVLCIDTTSAPVSCGFTPLSGDTSVGSWAYLTEADFVGRRLFGVETAGTGSLLCFDAALGTACPDSPIALEGATRYESTRPVKVGSNIVVKTATRIYCFDAQTLVPCGDAWPVTISSDTSTPVAPHTTAAGVVDGACYESGCFDLAGEPTDWVTPFVLGHSSWALHAVSGALTQGRYYFVGNDVLGVECFDYATGQPCPNFPIVYPSNIQLVYAIRVDPNNPSCMWINSDGGQIRVFDAFSGEAECTASPVITLQPSSFAPRFTCSTNDSIDEWRTLRLDEVGGNGTPGSVALTVRNAVGDVVPGWSDRAVAIGQALDMTGLDVTLSGSRPTFSFAFGDVTGGTIDSATIALDYTGKGPELCVRAELFSNGSLCPIVTGLDGSLIDGVTTPQTFNVRREFTIGTDISLCPEDIVEQTVPSAPRDLTGSGVDTTALLRFTPPLDDGGAALRGYRYSLDGGDTYTTATLIVNGDGTFGIALTGLTPGSYPVDLRATNSIGRSPSATMTLVVAELPPTTTAPPTTVPPTTVPPTTVPPTTVAPPAQQLELSLQLQAGDQVAGAFVDVDGEHLEPFSPVRVELHSTPILLGTATVAADGSFATTVQLPVDVPPGNHEIVAIGTGPAGQPVTATEPIFVDWGGALGATAPTGGFTAITPTRLLDTRSATPVGAESEYRLTIPSSSVPADVTALVVNVAVADPDRAGYVTVYRCGSVRPYASTINFVAGETIANLVEVAHGAGDEICVWTTATTDLVVDLDGYHSAAGSSRFEPQVAQRLLDTRGADGVEAGQVVELTVVGSGLADPSTTAVALHVTATDAGRGGFVTAYPCDVERPWASNLDVTPGRTTSNDVIVGVGAQGTVCLFSSAPTHLVVDFGGSFAPAAAHRFTALAPGRFIDTREITSLAKGETLELTLVADEAAPAGTTATALNVTVANPAEAGFLTVYPCDSERPWASNLNYAAGQIVASHVTTSVGPSGTVCVYSHSATDVVVDVEGIYRGS